MTMHVRDAGAWKGVIGLQVRDAGAWKPVLAGYVRDAGAWRQFYAPPGGGGGGGGGFSVSLSPNPADGFRTMNNFNTSGYVSVSITGTPAGFTSPTYSWARISGPSAYGAFSSSGTSTATVTIGATLPVFQDYTETWRLTVTEGANSATADVVVTLRIENLS
jgi:hypothetical protein